ncbi:MAG: dihydroneopterin triphosphate diphosphatase [Gammaproteobacteria bacterium]|nr:dihydroneopterin triphosphate diphosphatase [Gammaproteobacteria bacterium]
MAGFKRPESVLVVVYTARGEVLLLRRTHPSRFWQSVTGSLRWGETARHAARRELFEETGLHAGGGLVDCRHRERFPIVPPWRDRYAPSVLYNTEHLFHFKLPARRIVRLNAQEHTAARWIPIRRAVKMATSWTNQEAIADLAEPEEF